MLLTMVILNDVLQCRSCNLTGDKNGIRTVKLANKKSARSCACLSPFISGADFGIDCDVGLDVLFSAPLGTTADARCVMGFVPVQAFC